MCPMVPGCGTICARAWSFSNARSSMVDSAIAPAFSAASRCRARIGSPRPFRVSINGMTQACASIRNGRYSTANAPWCSPTTKTSMSCWKTAAVSDCARHRSKDRCAAMNPTRVCCGCPAGENRPRRTDWPTCKPSQPRRNCAAPWPTGACGVVCKANSNSKFPWVSPKPNPTSGCVSISATLIYGYPNTNSI